MKLNQIRDVVAVAELGGLRRAARHLGVAQPALTRSIRELEKELEAPLFERSAAGMVLTPIGKAFVRRGSAVQQELARAREEVAQLRGIATGTVCIALSTAPHVAMLPRVLEPFKRRYPRARLNIIEGLLPEIESGIRDGTIDFYVGPLTEDRSGSDLSVELLFENERVVLARPNHPLIGAQSLSDLVDASWVTTSITVDSDAELGPIFQSFGMPPPSIAVQAHSGLTMITVAASSDTLALLPRQWLGFAGATGLLVHIPIKERFKAPDVCIVRRAALPLTPVAEHLSDLFRRSAQFA